MSHRGRITAWILCLLVAVVATVSLAVAAPNDDGIRDDDNSASAGVSSKAVSKARQAEGGDMPDAGVEGLPDGGMLQDVSPTEATTTDDDEETAETDPVEPTLHWRNDPSLKRRPGSYIGVAMGYTMGFSQFTYESRDFSQSYELGPIHGSDMVIRVGDAFFDWLAVGFQVNIVQGTMGAADEPKTAAFGLYLDTTLYPWTKGFGIRPSVGLGFGYTQAGPESYKLGFGGPLSLSVSLTYEGRLTRLITLGPVIQVAWTHGEQYDSTYVIFGIEFMKWFLTAEG